MLRLGEQPKKVAKIEALENLKEHQLQDNRKMIEADSFFESFSNLDNSVYVTGALDTDIKELMGLAISIATRCDECVVYHMDRCVEMNLDKAKIIESIKVGVIAGGSITYPQARLAFRLLSPLLILLRPITRVLRLTILWKPLILVAGISSTYPLKEQL